MMERRRRKLRAAGEWGAMEMEVARLGAGVLDGGRIAAGIGGKVDCEEEKKY